MLLSSNQPQLHQPIPSQQQPPQTLRSSLSPLPQHLQLAGPHHAHHPHHPSNASSSLSSSTASSPRMSLTSASFKILPSFGRKRMEERVGKQEKKREAAEKKRQSMMIQNEVENPYESLPFLHHYKVDTQFRRMRFKGLQL